MVGSRVTPEISGKIHKQAEMSKLRKIRKIISEWLSPLNVARKLPVLDRPPRGRIQGCRWAVKSGINCKQSEDRTNIEV